MREIITTSAKAVGIALVGALLAYASSYASCVAWH
jgi:hypothetical protein